MIGRIIFNGNISSPTDLMQRVRPYIGSVGQSDRPPKVLLVTAAWGAGEFGEGGVKAALANVGVPLEAGGRENVSNLCAWHLWQSFLEKRPDVAAVAEEVAAVEEAVRQFYLEKTAFHADRIRRGCKFARERVPGFRLGGVKDVPRDPIRPDGSASGRDVLRRTLSAELVASIGELVDNDERMLAVLDELAATLPARTGLWSDPEWQATRRQLEERILEADAIFFFGGSPTSLTQALRFFDLRPALLETLRRGATFVAVSAGSLLLCERMIVYDDFAGDPLRRDFRLHDRGFGLVGGLQILPHCMDRIQTDDSDNLAYLARRFSTHICAGLNEESFLLVDLRAGSAVSIGALDGVYVFGRDGVKTRYDRGEEVPLD